MPVDHITAIAEPARAATAFLSPMGADWQRLTSRISELLAGNAPPDQVVTAIQTAVTELQHSEQAMPPTADVPLRRSSRTAFSLDRRRRTENDGSHAPRHEFAWTSPSAKKLRQQIERVAAVDSTVLLVGESGTGKSTIARMIHERSQRRDQPFVAVNCASLPRELMDAELFGHTRGAFTGAVDERMGKVEAADGGTLFLDEIGDLPIEVQPKLLTFLQERSFYRIGSNQLRRVNLRVISATHADLTALTAAHKFRQDLFFRLAVLRLEVPALRHRRSEIGGLIKNILDRIAREYGFASPQINDDALHALETYHWPGNFRELENSLENAVTFCRSRVITAQDLQLPFQDIHDTADSAVSSSLEGMTLAELERQAIIAALRHHQGNKAKTARALGISLRSVYNKMERHGIVLNRQPE